MQEQLISFETAKLAKEKRFTTNTTNIWEYEDSCEIVSQSLLQKWLREVHNIDINIGLVCNLNNKIYISYLYMNYILQNNITINSNKSYENILEESLQKALKLINYGK